MEAEQANLLIHDLQMKLASAESKVASAELRAARTEIQLREQDALGSSASCTSSSSLHLEAISNISAVPDVNMKESLETSSTILALREELLEVRLELVKAQTVPRGTLASLPVSTGIVVGDPDALVQIAPVLRQLETIDATAAAAALLILQEELSVVRVAAAAEASEKIHQLQLQLAESKTQLEARSNPVIHSHIYIKYCLTISSDGVVTSKRFAGH